MTDILHSWLTRLDARMARYTLLGHIRVLLGFWEIALVLFLGIIYAMNAIRLGQIASQTRLHNNVRMVQAHFAEWRQQVWEQTLLISEAGDLVRAVANGDSALAQDIALTRASILGINNVDVVDASGQFLVEVHQTEVLEFTGEDAVFQRALQGETFFTVLTSPPRGTIAPRYLLGTALPLRDAQGKVVGAVLNGKVVDENTLNDLTFGQPDLHTALFYDGELLFDDAGSHAPRLRERLENRDWVQQALDSRKPEYWGMSLPLMMAPYASAYVPVRVGEDTGTVVVVTQDMSTFLSYGSRTALIFAVGLAIGLWLLLQALAYLLMRVVTTPLDILNETVTAMAGGDYEREVPVLSSDAIGRLARNFNHMAVAIRERDARLQEFSRTLESQVAERTSDLRRMVTALQAAASAVVITDTRGIIQWVNPAFIRLTGYTAEEAIGQSTSILKSGMQSDDFYRQMWETIERSEVWSDDVVNRRKDGSLYVEHMTIAPVLDEAGKIQNYIAIKEDVTERQRLLDELQRARQEADSANQAKSQFLANMSHEFRTPLTAIIGYSELMEEDVRDLGYDDLLPDVQKIRQAGEYLASLVNAVLDLAKIEAGYMQLDLHTFPVDGVLRAVIASVEPLFVKSGNRLEVETQSALGEMTADQTKTRQILINLLSNANKFTRQGVVSLRTRRFADETGREWMEFQVQDTGIGMKPKELARVFDEFVQADISVTREFGGTGLGLSISKHFCEMMGGSIHAESTPGEGSTFTVRLPVVVEEEMQNEE
ncbi:MAG: hypothetical protein Fur0018_12330 [Anaerolineales bacterium]